MARRHPDADAALRMLGIDPASVKTLGILMPREAYSGGPMRFTVAMRPPTLNEIMRGRLRDRMRLGREFHRAVALAFEASGLPPAAGKRRVSLLVTLGPRQREFDVDAPWKAALDSLKHCGAILDDTVKSCALGDLGFVRGSAPSTEIHLEDAEDA